jgi:hypothetical protein
MTNFSTVSGSRYWRDKPEPAPKGCSRGWIRTATDFGRRPAVNVANPRVQSGTYAALTTADGRFSTRARSLWQSWWRSTGRAQPSGGAR